MAALLISMIGISYGQAGSVQPTATPTNMTSKYYRYLGYVGIDSGLFLPSRDTIFTPTGNKPAITRRPQDQKIYYYDSTSSKWVQLGGSINAYVNGGNSFGAAATIGLNDSFPLTFKDHNFNFFYLDPSNDLVTGQGWTLGGYALNSDAIYAQHRLYIPNDTTKGNNVCVGCAAITSQNGLPYYTLSESPTDGHWQRMALYSDIPSTSGFVPYTGATGSVNLGSYNLTATAVTSAKGKLDTTATNGVVTPTQLGLKLNKSNFYDSLVGRNATLLGNTTTGTGSTIVLSGSPTLTLPNISAINVSGGILSFPTGGSGTVALRGDTITRFTGLASLGKAYNDSLTLATAINTKGIGTITGVTAGINMTGGGTSGTVTVNADTTTGATKLSTQGYADRDTVGTRAQLVAGSGISITGTYPNKTISATSSGGLTGSGSPSTQFNPFSTWNTTNSVLSSTGNSYMTWDTTNNTLLLGGATAHSGYTFYCNGQGYFKAGVSQAALTLDNNAGGSGTNTCNLYLNGTNAGAYNNFINFGGNAGIGIYSGTASVSNMFNLTQNGNGYSILTTGDRSTFDCRNGDLKLNNQTSTVSKINGLSLLASGTGAAGSYRMLNMVHSAGSSSGTSGENLGTSYWYQEYSNAFYEGANFSASNIVASAYPNRGTTGFVWSTIAGNSSLTERMRLSGGALLINTTTNNGTDSLQVNGSASVKKINIPTGTNASVGTATLSSGTVTVSTTAVTASSIILLTYQNCSSCGTPYISTKTANTSFVITSSNGADGSIVGYQIIN